MALYYVTGISGSGKSTVGNELIRRGYTVHEVDDGLAAFYNNKTGEEVVRPLKPEERTMQWREQHTWKVPRDKIQKLVKKSTQKQVFVCGTASNDEEYVDLFSGIIALTVDEQTLKDRITTRTSGDFGKSPHELRTILDWQKYAAQEYEEMGAVLVDATNSVDIVADQVLALTVFK